jgi:signal transduction histidine kinase
LGSTTLFWTLQEVFQLRHYFPRIHKVFTAYILMSLLFLVTPFVGFYGVIAIINIFAVNAALWLCVGISIYLGFRQKSLYWAIGFGLLVYSTATTFTSISALGLIEFQQILYTAWHYGMVFLIIIVLGVTAQWVRMDALARRQQAQLERDLAHERDANMLQRQFIALVSHEFLNPLSAISLQTQLAQRELALGQGDSQKRFSAIERATNRLKKLFDQWLNNNRILEPDLELKPEPIALAQWIPSVIEDGLVYQDRELEFDLDDITLMADPELLKIALMNLVDNACKYSPLGTAITIRVERQNDFVRISVIDQGVGVPMEDQPYIFKRLFRTERHTNQPGLGLGLHFSQRITRLHGGEIHYAQLSPNRCAFFLLLPMHSHPG